MDEVYAWVDDEREKRRREFFQLLDRGRDIWTPRHIFDRCCVKWLIHGSIQPNDEYGGFYGSPFDPPKGCNGCSRDHPCITLRYDATTKSTIAHLSHRLDPFLHYMNGLALKEEAWPHSASEYKIDGYLRPNLTDLRSHYGFGGHLVKVEDSELGASDAAQLEEEEEKEANERAAKRPRKTEEGEEEDLNTEGLSAAAMDVVMKHRLIFEVQDDPLTLFCLRQVSKSFKKFAESVASAKVKTLNITVTPLVNGMQRFGDGKFDGYDSETFRSDCFGFEEDANVAEYTKREKILLDFQPSETGDSGYKPTSIDAATIAWDSGVLDRDPDPEDEDWSDYAENADCAYCDQMLRVYWHPKDADPVKSPVHTTYYREQKSFGVLIAEFPLGSRYRAGVKNISHSGVAVSFDVLENNISETEEVDEEDENGERRVWRYIQYSGRIKLISVKVDFSVLVRLHAFQVMRELHREYERIKKERPLTTTESEYLKFVGIASKQG